ncbi:NUDIX domain-containing protein [Psychrobacter sp. I-STPA10]|uniref:NUDIX domain-containing protein n=1 Tax=Psychrobacter sp. I-STPA10 TaxID=2585769 RepID=UPI003FA6A306
MRDKNNNNTAQKSTDKDIIKHTLTHFHWYLTPFAITLDKIQTNELSKQLDKTDINFIWCDIDHAKTLGFPKTMLKVLSQ